MRRLVNISIFILLLIFGAGCKYQKVLKKGTPAEKLQAAKDYYNKEDYIRALPLFEDLLTAYRRKPEAEEIYYYYSYCHYGMRDFLMASYNFKNFADNYPRSKHAVEAAFMSAKCEYHQSQPYYLDQTSTRKAINKIQLFINRYPTSEYVEEGNKLIDELRAKLHKKAYNAAMLYYKMESFNSAFVSFKNAIADYPDIPQKEEMEFLIVKSAYLYAQRSFLSSQKERFETTITEGTYYLEDDHSNEAHIKEVKRIVSDSKKQLERVEKLLNEQESIQEPQ